MIEYVKGELVDVTPAFAVIEANGVGYGLNISLNTYSAIQGKASSPDLWSAPLGEGRKRSSLGL